MENKLRNLGLTNYEISIYKALLEYGRMGAKVISEKSGVPLTAVYPNLKSLVEKGLIQQFEGETKIFEPLNPESGLSSFIEKRKKSLVRIKEDLIEETKKAFQSKQIHREKEVLRLTHGIETSATIYDETFKKVKESFFILGWKMTKISDKYQRLKVIKKAIQRGVDVRLLLIGPPQKAWSVIKAYQDASVKIRYSPLENFSIFVADKKECKITLKDRKLPDRYNIQILDESLAKAMHFYFLEAWKKAEKVEPERYLEISK